MNAISANATADWPSKIFAMSAADVPAANIHNGSDLASVTAANEIAEVVCTFCSPSHHEMPRRLLSECRDTPHFDF